MKGRVLIVAGSDSGGGAGIQADIKTVTALGGYAATAITALTAQDSRGVGEIFPVPAAFVGRQMGAVLGDIGADCIKTGMLVDGQVIAAVAGVIADAGAGIPLVVDPVMRASDGTRLLEAGAVEALKSLILSAARVITPNVIEAAALSGLTIADCDDMKRAAVALLGTGAKAVLVTGGDLGGDRLFDVLADADGCRVFDSRPIASRHTHGTGCTLASAIATLIAQGLGVHDAVAGARVYVREAIRAAPGFGQGRGPLNHGHTLSQIKG